MKILDLIEAADQDLAEAELVLEQDYLAGVKLFQVGIGKLCQAYLYSKQQNEIPEVLKELFQKCLVVNSEFEAVQEEFVSLIEAVENHQAAEILIDTVNEIWDFVIDLIPEFTG